MKKLLLLLSAAFLLLAAPVFAQDSAYTIATTGTPIHAAVGDLNNDGNPDLIFVTFATDSVITMLGNGDGTFGNRRAVGIGPLAGVGPFSAVALGDFNEDGKLDVAVATRGSTNLLLYLGNGNGSLQAPIAVSTGGYPAYWIVTGDFNPGFVFPFGFILHTDIAILTQVTADPNTDSVFVFYGNGGGGFPSVTSVATGAKDAWFMATQRRVFFLERSNLVVSHRSGVVSVLLSNGTTAWPAPVTISTPGVIDGIVWDDLNGDGKLDLAYSVSNDSAVYVQTGNTLTSYNPSVRYATARGGSLSPYGLASGDFNGDGYTDLVAGNVGVDSVSFLINNQAGGFKPSINKAAGLNSYYGMTAADINNNGLPDVIAGTAGGSAIAVFNLRGPQLNPALASLGTPPAGTPFALPAGTATDSTLVSSIRFLYRQMGGTAFDTLNFSLGAGTKQRSFSLTLPANVMTDHGLEYALLTSDGFITERRPLGSGFYRMRTTVNENAPATPTGIYQLVSFPIAVNPPSAASQIADNFSLTDPKVARLFWWDPVLADTTKDTTSLKGYREYGSAGFPDFVSGRSMYLATTSSMIYNGTGLSTLPDTAGNFPERTRLVIDSGWNMVASPYPYSVMFDSLEILLPDSSFHQLDSQRTNRISRGSVLWTRSAQNVYVTDSVFRPWKGYFLKDNIKQQVVLLFPKGDYGLPLAAPPAPKVAYPGLDWKLDITARSEDRTATPAILGTSKNADRGRNAMDLEFPPPLAGDLRIVFQKGKEFGVPGDYISDIRPPLTSSETWSFTVQPGGTRAIEMGFDGLAEVPANYDVILTDKEGRAKQNLRTEPVYRFIAVEDRHFELTVTPKVTGQTALLPTRYELYQNMPNPFNPQTLIKYDLPEAASVRLDVFNILGQKVTTLVNRYEAAGPKSVLWDGTDQGGSKVSSGIYLYKISAGDYTATKKMIYLK